ncbi:septum formation family protein [Jiangella endophytica]|uniref:septum formation family protein n=1 Tax=Jiangella endophytica TaxID=1623398 RepID=UPI0018E52DE3|nr:septum formation family protein [Jiangella endophytica]
MRSAGVAVLALVMASCGLLGDDGDSDAVGVLDIEVGQCFTAPAEVQAELTELTSVPCDSGHDQEAYAVVAYTGPDGEEAGAFPGADALTRFADGACAQEFGEYVGTSYLDSSLFFTYLLPSVRGWEDGDSDVVCFVTTTGAKLDASVRDSGM